MENNVNKPAESKSNRPSLLAVIYGTSKGSYSSMDSFNAFSFDEEYFSASTDTTKQLICNKDCRVTVKGLVGIPHGAWMFCSRNGNYILGSGRVYTTNFTGETTIDVNAGDYFTGRYQQASDRVNAGGCYLFYLPIEE